MKTNETWTGYATCLRSSSEPLAWAGLDGRSSSFDPSVLSDKRTHTASFASLHLPNATKCTALPCRLWCTLWDGKICRDCPQLMAKFPWSQERRSLLGRAHQEHQRRRHFPPQDAEAHLTCLGTVRPWTPATQKAASSLLWPLSANTSIPTLSILYCDCLQNCFT